MIIPSARLIWLTVGIAFPAAIVAAVLPQARVGSAIVLVACVVTALLDVLARRKALAGLRVELPALLRLVSGRPASIEVRIHNPSAAARKIRLGFGLPEGIDFSPEDQWIGLPRGSAVAKVSWQCDPRRRGTVQIRDCYLEASSPLGLWSVRRRDDVKCEVRVYPNLRDDALQALKRGFESRTATRQIGRGREFEKLREYTPGDSSDEIHWKATARRGRPITKVFQVERTQEVYVVLDTSRLSGRMCGSEPALEQAIRAALTVGAAAERRGDLFGVAAFSSQVETFVRARAGKTHYAACRDAINELTPRFVSPDFDEIATLLRLRLRRRALILFLTALDDSLLAERFASAMKLLSRQHLVLTGMLQPASVRPLFANAEIDSAADVYRSLAGHLGWKKLRELQRTLSRQGVHLALLEPDKFTASLVTLYHETKQRQLL